ncbi:hypothetical protein [Bacillus sp. NEB1478]|uniref:hypothetical protein n=1 Tax=Bacillus sp. NEB1478 TaxID=3073816 RepID=UPI002873A6F4|nr:hypothetical protein [Bacillus sp. NEB1478]WNB91798.1 hypothetical protein RGB74_18270 [Bacillus sp. NEB1478]
MGAIILFIIIGCVVAGIRLWKRKRILSLVLFSPAMITIGFIGYFIYESSYHTNPDSVQFSVQKENHTYYVTGTWKDRLDGYRFPSDFLVFYVPNNEQVLSVKRDRMKNYKKADWDFLNGQVKDWVDKKPHPKVKPQIFDLKTDKEFTFSFTLPENIEPGDVKLYYAHTREEPMDALEFWFKAIKIK